MSSSTAAEPWFYIVAIDVTSMADWNLNRSEKEKLKELADKLDTSPTDVFESVTDVKYLSESADSYIESAKVQRLFLSQRLEEFEKAVHKLFDEYIEIEFDDLTIAIENELEQALEEGIPKRGDIDIPQHPVLRIQVADDEITYMESSVNEEEIENLRGEWDSFKGERAVSAISSEGYPVIEHDLVAEFETKDEYPLLTIKEIERDDFCKKVVGHGRFDEVLDWLTNCSLEITQEMEERFGGEKEFQRQGKYLFGYRDEKEAVEVGETERRYPKTKYRIKYYSETDMATSAVGLEIYDYRTDELLDVHYWDSDVTLSELASEFLEGAFWMMDDAMG